MMEEKDIISACWRKGHGNKAIVIFIGMLNHGVVSSRLVVKRKR